MRWLDSLEVRLGRFAIPHLTRIVVVLSLLVWGLIQVNPRFLEALVLWPAAVREGEVWRLVSFLFIPPGAGFLTLFYLLFLWTMGEGLEEAWGSFKVNVFYLVGMIGTVVAAWLFDGVGTAAYLNLSLSFAFATLYPDYPVLLFVIQVRVKWLALISAGLQVVAFALGNWSTRAMIVISLANYFLFFWSHWRRVASDRAYAARRRREFERAQGGALGAKPPEEANAASHTCHVCGRTGITNPELEFRVSSVDDEEYCLEHLPKRPARA